MNSSLVVANITTLVTLKPLTRAPTTARITEGDLGALRVNGSSSARSWLVIRDGKVAATGTGQLPGDAAGLPTLDARGGLVLPGLVDAHTHLVYAGSRANEFAARLAGKSYQEIAAGGGGIQASVGATRHASDDELARLVATRLDAMLARGTTTVETKTGYALSVEEELRQLRVCRRIASDRDRVLGQTLHITCLGPHAIPPEFSGRPGGAREFADILTNQLLPTVIRDKLADSVDAFVERGWFEPEDVRGWFQSAIKGGLNARVHADEFADSGAAAFAGEISALSADHCQQASAQGIAAMARASTVAMLLPGTSLYSKIPYADARRFIAAGCQVGLATDHNPGSSIVDNLPLLVTVGALHCGLTPAEAIAAVTFVPARSLGLADRKGHLAEGADADFAIWPMPSTEDFVADLGRTLPTHVAVRGKIVAGTKQGDL